MNITGRMVYSYPTAALFFGLVQLQLRFDILVVNFQTRFVAAAYQTGPGHLRLR